MDSASEAASQPPGTSEEFAFAAPTRAGRTNPLPLIETLDWVTESVRYQSL